MAKISLYQFYRSYFNYPKGKNKFYARAIGETNALFKEILMQKSIMPIIRYQKREYKNPVTTKLLENLVKISEVSYENPFKDIEYFESTIIIDKKYLSTRRRGIFINLMAGIDRAQSKMIFLVYSSSFNMVEENNVLYGLLKQFPITKKSPVKINKIAYWNLSRGEVFEIDTKGLKCAERKELIEAANKI